MIHLAYTRLVVGRRDPLVLLLLLRGLIDIFWKKNNEKLWSFIRFQCKRGFSQISSYTGITMEN